MSFAFCRPFAAEDASAVAALEAICNPVPWSAESLLAFAESPQPSSAPEGEVPGLIRVGLVAPSSEGEPVGYLFAHLVAGEAEILILGVHPEARRRGLARALLEALFARLRALEASRIFLEVRTGNSAAVKLYEESGFGRMGVRKGYYPDNGEDAVLFSRRIR